MEAALRDGYDVRGMLYWSLTDNFEWQEGFDMKVDGWSGWGNWLALHRLNGQTVHALSKRWRWRELTRKP